jgi:hypothetical protein
MKPIVNPFTGTLQLIPHSTDTAGFYARNILVGGNHPVTDKTCYTYKHFSTAGYRLNEYEVMVPYAAGRYACYGFKDGGGTGVMDLMRIKDGVIAKFQSYAHGNNIRSGAGFNGTLDSGSFAGTTLGGSITRSATKDEYIDFRFLVGHSLFWRGPYFTNGGFGLVSINTSFTAATNLPAVASTDFKNITNAVNNGSGLVRITSAAHGYTGTTTRINVEGVGGVTAANGTWQITVIDANTFDLVGSTFSGTYTSGGTHGFFLQAHLGFRYINFYGQTALTDESILLAEGLADSTHTVRFTVLGTNVSASTDARVYVSGVAAASIGQTLPLTSFSTGSATAAGNTLTVSDTTGIVPGDVLFIGSGSVAETKTVSSVTNATTLVVLGTFANTYSSQPVFKYNNHVCYPRYLHNYMTGTSWSAIGPVWDYAPTGQANYQFITDVHGLEVGITNQLRQNGALIDDFRVSGGTRMATGYYSSGGTELTLERRSGVFHPSATLNTTTSGTNSIGQPVINVANATGFAVGDTIFIINTALTTFQYAVISSIASNAITLTTNLLNSHSSSSYVGRTTAVSASSGNTAGQATLTLVSASGFAAGERIVVGSGDTVEQHVIRSVAAPTLTLMDNLANAQNSVSVRKSVGHKIITYTFNANQPWSMQANWLMNWHRSGIIRTGYPMMLPLSTVRIAGGSYETKAVDRVILGNVTLALPQVADDNNFYGNQKTDLVTAYSTAHDTVISQYCPRLDVTMNNWANSSTRHVALQSKSDGVDKVYWSRSMVSTPETVTAGHHHEGMFNIRVFRIKGAATALS